MTTYQCIGVYRYNTMSQLETPCFTLSQVKTEVSKMKRQPDLYKEIRVKNLANNQFIQVWSCPKGVGKYWKNLVQPLAEYQKTKIILHKTRGFKWYDIRPNVLGKEAGSAYVYAASPQKAACYLAREQGFITQTYNIKLADTTNDYLGDYYVVRVNLTQGENHAEMYVSETSNVQM